MKTLFVPLNSFIIDRHRTFLQTLDRHFHLIVLKHDRTHLSLPNATLATDIVGHLTDVRKLDEYPTQLRQYREFVKEQTEAISERPLPDDVLSAEIDRSNELLARCLTLALMLGELAKKTSIDGVVVGADYTRHARPMVFMAKQLGIPSITIEHGAFGGFSWSSFYRDPPKSIANRYASDYVVLDNKLEVEIMKNRPGAENVNAFLPLGTPVEKPLSDEHLSRDAARQHFGLQNEHICVTITPSWNEPLIPAQVLRSHFEEAQCYRFVFSTLAKSPLNDRIRIIVKLHPAIGDFGQFDAVSAYIQKVAAETGCTPSPSIVKDGLERAMAASDVIIGFSRTSVLWQSAMMGIATAQVLFRNSIDDLADNPNDHTPLATTGLFSYVETETDLTDIVNRIGQPDTHVHPPKALTAFKEKWELEDTTTDEKIDRIIEWMKTHL